MKFYFIFSLILFTGMIQAQDLVVTPEGDSLNCRIDRIKNDFIYISFIHNGEKRNTMIQLDQANYQYNFYKKVVVDPNHSETKAYYTWRLALYGGLSFRTGKLQAGLNPQESEYLKKLKSGSNYGFDLSLFVSEAIGLGLRINTFKSQNSEKNILISLPDGSSIISDVSDNISIDYVGPVFLTHLFNASKNKALLLDFSIGYLRYQDNATFGKGSFQIRSGTIGLGFGVGYDFLISKNFGLGFSISALTGTLTKIKVSNSFSSVQVKLDEKEYESLARIDLTVGLRFYR